MIAGRLNVLMGLQHYQRPGYRPHWRLYLISGALWLGLVWACWWAL